MNYKEDNLTLLHFHPLSPSPRTPSRTISRSSSCIETLGWESSWQRWQQPAWQVALTSSSYSYTTVPTPMRSLLKKPTPLFSTTSTRQERDRLTVIRILLEASANFNECHCIDFWWRRRKGTGEARCLSYKLPVGEVINWTCDMWHDSASRQLSPDSPESRQNSG